MDDDLFSSETNDGGSSNDGAEDMPDDGSGGSGSNEGVFSGETESEEMPDEYAESDMFEEVESLFGSEVKVDLSDYVDNRLFDSDVDYRFVIKNYGQKVHSLTFCDPVIFSSDVASFDTIGLNQKNTWYDWHLIPTARPSIASPELREKYIEIPGFDGYLDLTDLRSGKFGARDGSISFYVINKHGFWADRKREIENYIHGKMLFMFLDEDPEWYYIGRWKFDGWENNTDGICSTCTFSYHLQPDIYSVSADNLVFSEYND